MTLAFSYPFIKKITYWPQLFLGITFNWGIIMAGSSILNTVTTEIILSEDSFAIADLYHQGYIYLDKRIKDLESKHPQFLKY